MSTYKKYVKQLKPITFITFDDKSIWDNESGVLVNRSNEIFDESENGDPINGILHYDDNEFRYSYALGQRSMIENQPTDSYSLMLGAYERDDKNVFPFPKTVLEIPFNERLRLDKSFTVSLHFNKYRADSDIFRSLTWDGLNSRYITTSTNTRTFTRTIFRKGNGIGLTYHFPWSSSSYITIKFPNNNGTVLLSNIPGNAINRDVHLVYTHKHIINEAGQYYTHSIVYWDNRIIYEHRTNPVFGEYSGGNTSPFEFGGYVSSNWDPNFCDDRTTTRTSYDQISIYDYALEDFQVSDLYKKCYQYETIVQRSFPTLYYRFNELKGERTFDGSDSIRPISFTGADNVDIEKEKPGVHGLYGSTRTNIRNKAMLYCKPVSGSYNTSFFNPSGDFTIDFFASFDSYTKGVVLSLQDDVHPFRGLAMFINCRHNVEQPGSIQLSISDSEYILTEEKTPRGEIIQYNDGVVRHYTIRRSGNYIELWINAVFIDKIYITTGNLTSRTNQLYLFGLLPGNSFVSGSLQHMAFYTRALSARELAVRSSYLIKYTIRGRVTVQGIGQTILIRIYSFNSGQLIHQQKSDGNGDYNLVIPTDDYITVIFMDVGNINIRPRTISPILPDEYEDIPWE